MISKIPFTVVDLETTGARPGVDRVIEIGAIKILDGKIIDSYTTLVNPGRAIPHIITQITGISSDMVENAPSFFEVAHHIRSFADESIFIAHNVHFDYGFLNAELVRTDYPPLETPFMCTIKMARRVFPGFLHYNLGDLCRSLKVPLKRAHRALDDCEATALLLLKMLNKLAACGVEDIESFKSFYEQSPREAEEWYHRRPSSNNYVMRKTNQRINDDPARGGGYKKTRLAQGAREAA